MIPSVAVALMENIFVIDISLFKYTINIQTRVKHKNKQSFTKCKTFIKENYHIKFKKKNL